MPIDYRRERTIDSIADDALLTLGAGSDAALVLRSTALAADAELGSVIVGTSDHPGVAANSLIVSNITADGDIMLAVQSGGNTTMSMLMDASAGTLVVNTAVDIQGGYANGGGAPYDGVVDEGGGGNWTTAQDGDDDLDAGSYSMLVKSGTYSTLTVSTNLAYIFLEPETTFTGAIVLSGDHVTLVVGAGSDVQGLVTLSGNNNSLICQNGVDLDGISCTGDYPFVDGGGWETVSDAGTAATSIDLNGALYGIVQNIACNTTSGSGGGNNAARMRGASTGSIFKNIKVIDSDNIGIVAEPSGGQGQVIGCTILGADGQGIQVNGPECRIIDNYIVDAGDDGISFETSGDNSTCTGNIVKDHGANAIEITVNAENCVVVGNRTDGAVSDGSGTSTVASNDVTAF
jgi:hypothetical protein